MLAEYHYTKALQGRNAHLQNCQAYATVLSPVLGAECQKHFSSQE